MTKRFQILSPVAAAMVAAVLFCGGCVAPRVTLLEQEESFKPYGELSVGDEQIRDFAQLRTAVVLSGEQLQLQEFRSEPLPEGETTIKGTVRFELGAKSFSGGSAAAVDHRGYFVTAAHCIEESGVTGDIYVVFPRSKKQMLIKKARVVWAGDESSSDGLDFAVVKIASRVPYVFDWGAVPQIDDLVVSVGNSSDSDSELSLMMAPLGGKVVLAYGDQNSAVGGMQICHDSPLRKGNSGGPLIDLRGRLVGVNYAQCLSIETLLRRQKRCGYAVRPDIKWLAGLIDRDHAALYGKKGRTR